MVPIPSCGLWPVLFEVVLSLTDERQMLIILAFEGGQCQRSELQNWLMSPNGYVMGGLKDEDRPDEEDGCGPTHKKCVLEESKRDVLMPMMSLRIVFPKVV